MSHRIAERALWCGMLWMLGAAGAPHAEESVAAEPAPVKSFDLAYVRPTLPEKKADGKLLPGREDVRPRILVPEGGLEEMIKRSKTTHKAIAERVRDFADRIIKEGINKKPRNAESPMRWELRKPGQLAWAYAATGEKKYRKAAVDWAMACCAYPQWDINVDLAAGHAMVSLAQVWDWFNEDFTPEQRKIMLAKMRLQGNLLASPFGAKKVKGGTWWTKSYLQNHGSVNSAGLFAAGIAFYKDLDDAPRWLALAEGYMDNVFLSVFSDGSSMEGVNYWAYGVEHLMLYAELAKPNTGRDFFATCGNIRNAGTFLLAMTTPWLEKGDHVVPYGAASLSTGTHGPSHILFKSASVLKNPYLQDLGLKCWHKGFAESSGMQPYALLYYDGTVAAEPYTESPTAYCFPELGIVSTRSDWSPEATLVWFKCGASLGRAVPDLIKHNVGSSHARSDQGAFQFITRGDRLAIYGNHHNHNQNMITFRGVGQHGEPVGGAFEGLRCKEAFAAKQPELLSVQDGPALTYMVGNPGVIYREEAGVKRYRRHLLFVKPDALLVVDDIELDEAKAADKTKPDVSWHLQTLPLPKQRGEGHFAVEGEKGAMDVYLCWPQSGFAMKAETPEPMTGYMLPGSFRKRHRLRVDSTQPTTQAVLVTCLVGRGPKDEAAARPEVTLEERVLRFRLPGPKGGAWTLDLDALKVSGF